INQSSIALAMGSGMKQLELLKYYSKVLFLSTLAFLGLFLLFRWALNAHGVQLLSWQVLSLE
ncbi:hypothetical protein, partial [Serratia marcescens]|uniref:hypothetical protein n=1 Tax=Serratia marcescens TaxID=615 RepID=UPI0013D8E811